LVLLFLHVFASLNDSLAKHYVCIICFIVLSQIKQINTTTQYSYKLVKRSEAVHFPEPDTTIGN